MSVSKNYEKSLQKTKPYNLKKYFAFICIQNPINRQLSEANP